MFIVELQRKQYRNFLFTDCQNNYYNNDFDSAHFQSSQYYITWTNMLLLFLESQSLFSKVVSRNCYAHVAMVLTVILTMHSSLFLCSLRWKNL